MLRRSENDWGLGRGGRIMSSGVICTFVAADPSLAFSVHSVAAVASSLASDGLCVVAVTESLPASGRSSKPYSR